MSIICSDAAIISLMNRDKLEGKTVMVVRRGHSGLSAASILKRLAARLCWHVHVPGILVGS